AVDRRHPRSRLAAARSPASQTPGGTPQSRPRAPAGPPDPGPAGRHDTDDPGEPVTRIRPRALMIPPGYPDFMSRTRFVRLGEQIVQGGAWSGWAPVDRVEVSTDGGATWEAADLGPAAAQYGRERRGDTWCPCRAGE